MTKGHPHSTATGTATPQPTAALATDVPTAAPAEPQQAPTPSPLRLGEILLQHGVITDAQLHEALHLQQALTTYRPLGQILIDQHLITPTQLHHYLEQYHKQLSLSDVLLKACFLTEPQLQTAVAQQKDTGLPLSTVLLRLRYVSEEALQQALSLQLNLPCVMLDQLTLDRSLARLLNKHYAQRHHVIPVSRVDDTLTLAMDDPADTEVIRDLQTSTGCAIRVVVATRTDIQHAFHRIYGEPQETALIAESFELIAETPALSSSKFKYVEEYHENRHADEIVRHLIGLALSHQASDIHLETVEQHMHVRYRIDGVLQQLYLGALEADIDANQQAIVSRIKIMGKLDIAEKRRPQDGSFRVQVAKDGHRVKIDFRISIVPGHYGENVVLRVLDPCHAPRSIDQLGFWPPITAKLKHLLQRTTGLLLITGPTGSGKSTTLYGVLRTLYRPTITVLTAEDPVEYVYDEFTQCEVNEKIGNTFATYLRAFLRHDPEVIMVGEIRDEETAEMTFRAAQTGHFVLSTLHTNNAIGALPRLLDLSIEANLITSCLLGVLSQRLVRQVCPTCKAPYEPAADLLQEFFECPPAGLRWYQGRGCTQCNFTGYKGRLVVAELWVPSDDDVVLINKAAPFDDITHSALKHTLLMAEDVLDKLRQGHTNLEELIRTLPYSCLQQLRDLTPQRPLTVARRAS